MKKDCKASAVELMDFKYIIVCKFRSPGSDFWIFSKNLEMIIQIIHSRNKRIILCGDWNLNFMQVNIRLKEVQNLLECYGLINMVRPRQELQVLLNL
jgi:hypothetical protein